MHILFTKRFTNYGDMNVTAVLLFCEKLKHLRGVLLYVFTNDICWYIGNLFFYYICFNRYL